MTQTASRPRRASAPSQAARRSDTPLLITYYWTTRHCVIPDGFRQGEPFEHYGWQKKALLNHYLVRGDAEWVPENPLLRSAFVYRMSLIVGPQKVGKDPFEASQICLEGVGPALFGGWAGKDEGFVCAEHGCRCGWEYAYDEGEPKGMLWPTPLIQIIGVSEEATDNTYSALRPMIELGPLADLIPKTGEEFIRLPGGGRIMTVTSSAPSRLGARVTFPSMGEAGIYTSANGMQKVADTVLRNAAGTGGRASMHTNAWDPGEHSVAQQHYESSAKDIYRQFTQPPANLSYTNKAERHRIHQLVYPEDVRRENGGHLELSSIEAEAADLVARDPAQAARFYGNKLVSGGGKAFDAVVWNDLADRKHTPDPNNYITLGFDGSRSDDWTALIATEVSSGYQWPLGIWNPRDYLSESAFVDAVNSAVNTAFADLNVWRMYCDPPYWKDEIAAWQGQHGEKTVIKWETYRDRQIAWAVRNYSLAIGKHAISHDGNVTFATHIGNAYKRPLNVRDDKGATMWTIAKETPDSGLKIDAAMAAVLSWEARTDAIASGLGQPARSVTADDLEFAYMPG